MFPGRTAPKIDTSHSNISGAQLFGKIRPYIRETMFGQLVPIRYAQISCWDNHIRIYVIAKRPHPSFNLHLFVNLQRPIGQTSLIGTEIPFPNRKCNSQLLAGVLDYWSNGVLEN